MDWKRLPRKLLSCWVGDGAKGVWGAELTHGKSDENVLSRTRYLRSGPEKKGPHADLDGGSSGLRRKPRRIQPVLGTEEGKGEVIEAGRGV
jgi:hypothetical protein